MLGRKGIVIVFVAFAVGGIAGWLAESAWGGAAVSSKPPYHDSLGYNIGRARSPSAPKPFKVTEAELAALRERAASLEKELKDRLDAREKKAKADAQEKGGGDSQKGKLEVSVDEALWKCSTFGELKQRYPDAWREWHGKLAEHATRVLKKYDSWRGFMSSINVSSMTDEERENHARLMEIYERKHALLREAELSDDDEMTMARFKENNIKMYHLEEEGRKLMAAERNTLLRITAENMGRRLGWQEADTAEFAETLRAVGDATSGDLTN